MCPNDGARLLDVHPDDRSDALIGALFDGRFRVLRKLGEGGMGTVYAARQLDAERDVAIKILKVDYLRDENIRKRFMYEARTISELAHPNAVRLYDFGQSPEGSFYMVMELLGGESLADRLAYRFLTYREIFDVVPPICGVLGEAHHNGVIHRDLKPENIYLASRGSALGTDQSGEMVTGEDPKLLDFGIAKHLRDETMTKSGTLWGTPAYMSPEQAKGDRVEAAADIYAVGIILYEMICGNLPFHATTQMGLAMKHISVPARPLSSIPGLTSVPEELDELVLQLLDKSPEERPNTMDEVAERLLAIRERFFDDVLLDSVPAEEVDAIELQQWIADEPAVEDVRTSVPGAEFVEGFASPRVETGPLVAADGEPSLHGRAAAATLANADVTGELAAATVEEVMRGLGEGRDSRMLLIGGGLAALLVVVAALVVVFTGGSGGAEAEESEESKEAAILSAETSEAASGTAGSAASKAASVIMSARAAAERMKPAEDFIVVDGIEVDGAPSPAKSQRRRPASSGSAAAVERARPERAPRPAGKVKSAIENTF